MKKIKNKKRFKYLKQKKRKTRTMARRLLDRPTVARTLKV